MQNITKYVKHDNYSSAYKTHHQCVWINQKVLPAGVKPEEEHLVSGITGESLDSILYKVGLHCHRATPGLSTRL